MVRVLICDDDPAMRFILTRVLTREYQVEVTEASGGLEAVNLLANSPFDLLILDLQMPGVDGHETLRTIRTSAALRDLPVLVVSGERESDAIERVIRLGIAGFILKPLDRETTMTSLRTVIQRIEANARAGSQP